MLHELTTERTIGGFYEAFNALGPGLPEQAYQNALRIILADLGMLVETEVPAVVLFRGQVIARFRLDMIVEKRIIVECKAASGISDAHKSQLSHYLTATGIDVGLILNFGSRPTFSRIARAHTRTQVEYRLREAPD